MQHCHVIISLHACDLLLHVILICTFFNKHWHTQLHTYTLISACTLAPTPTHTYTIPTLLTHTHTPTHLYHTHTHSCRGGVGRSGTFTLVDATLRKVSVQNGAVVWLCCGRTIYSNFDMVLVMYLPMHLSSVIHSTLCMMCVCVL